MTDGFRRHPFLAALGACLAALLVFFFFIFHWNWLRAAASGQASKYAGRTIAIDGDFDVDLSLTPRVRVTDLSIANMPSGTKPEMARIERLEFTLALKELLKGNIVIPELVIEKPVLLLEKDKEGNANWNFSANPAASVASSVVPDERSEVPIIQRIRIEEGALTYRDPVKNIVIDTKLSNVRGESEGEEALTLKGNGTFQKRKFLLDVSGGSVLHLQEDKEPYPLRAHIVIGRTVIDLKGTLLDPLRLKGMDMELRLKGADAAELFPIFGIAFLPSPPYDVKGRLDYQEKRWSFSGFSGHMGASDLSGDVVWDIAGKLPKLTGDFTSDTLDMKDLGGLIGLKPGKEAEEESPYVFPDSEIDLSHVRAMNAEVSFVGKHIRQGALPLEDFKMKLNLTDGVITLQPVAFGMAEGDISAHIRMDANQNPVDADLDAALSRISLDRLLRPVAKKLGDKKAGSGFLKGRAKLKGRGNSLHQILGNSTGEIGIGMEGGELSNLLLEIAGFDIAEGLGFLAQGDRLVPIRCVALHFAVADGWMETRSFVIDTTDTILIGKGNASFKDETLNFKLKPEPKDKSLLAARVPLNITGTFKDISVLPDAGAVAVKGGIAVALSALLTPLAAWAAFIELGPGENSNCVAGLEAVKGVGRH